MESLHLQHTLLLEVLVAFIFLLLQVLAFSVDLTVDAQDVENTIDQVCYKNCGSFSCFVRCLWCL